MNVYKFGEKVKFRDAVRDVRSDADVTVREGIVNGEPIGHEDSVYWPVYVRDGDRRIIVHEANILVTE